VAGRDFHRRLVAFHRQDGLIHLDDVAHFNHQLNDGHLCEVSNIWNFDVYQRRTCHVYLQNYYAYSGLILSVLMPYFLMASATLATGTLPSSLKALRAATTM